MVNPYGFHVGTYTRPMDPMGTSLNLKGPRGLEIPLAATVSFKEHVLTFMYFRDYENTPIFPQFFSIDSPKIQKHP